jgi:hypothetical protein
MAKDFGDKPWSLVHHVCLKSAVERINPKDAFLYYEYEPTGPWWALSRKLLTPVQIKAPREVFGRPLQHVAHRSDVVRLQKLLELGGIYLDADILVHRSFDDLLGASTVLGQEGKYGLANAVILAEPDAPFLGRWMEQYRTFRGTKNLDANWSEHSVRLPGELAARYPSEVTILPPNAFYWPLWTPDHIDWIFASTRHIPLEGVYANHLWESIAWTYLEDLTPKQVRSRDSNFHLWARPLLVGVPDTHGAPSIVRKIEKLKVNALKEVLLIKSGIRRHLKDIVRETKPERPQ